MSIFATITAGALATLRSVAGEQVTYYRGGAAYLVPACRGKSDFQIDDGTSIRVESTDRDYLIGAADLANAGLIGTPARGDRIIDNGEVYECQAPTDGSKPWAWSDPAHTTYRIHSKKVT